MLGLRDLALPSPRITPLPLEGLLWPSWILALLVAGWATGQLTRRAGIALGPAAALFAIAVAIAAKQVRYPSAPLTGDGFEILVWGYALIGLLGAALAQIGPRLQPDGAVASAVAFLAIAAVLGAVPYLLAA